MTSSISTSEHNGTVLSSGQSGRPLVGVVCNTYSLGGVMYSEVAVPGVGVVVWKTTECVQFWGPIPGVTS
jgi:hypothetical protein